MGLKKTLLLNYWEKQCNKFSIVVKVFFDHYFMLSSVLDSPKI
jgi:hypothetical protein